MSLEQIKTLYEKQLAKKFPIEDEILNYTISRPMPASDMLSLYELRYEIYQSSENRQDKYKEQWEFLLSNLRAFKGEHIKFHHIYYSTTVACFFTDEDTTEILGTFITIP